MLFAALVEPKVNFFIIICIVALATADQPSDNDYYQAIIPFKRQVITIDDDTRHGHRGISAVITSFAMHPCHPNGELILGISTRVGFLKLKVKDKGRVPNISHRLLVIHYCPKRLVDNIVSCVVGLQAQGDIDHTSRRRRRIFSVVWGPTLSSTREPFGQVIGNSMAPMRHVSLWCGSA